MLIKLDTKKVIIAANFKEDIEILMVLLNLSCNIELIIFPNFFNEIIVVIFIDVDDENK